MDDARTPWIECDARRGNGEAVAPVTGVSRVVQCAPKVALALGYDVDAALERREL